MLTSAIMLISQINNRSAPPCCFVIKVSHLLSVSAQLNCNIAPSSEIPAIWQNYLSSKAFAATSSKQIGMGWSPKKVARAGPNFSPGEFRLVKLTQKFHTRGGGGGGVKSPASNAMWQEFVAGNIWIYVHYLNFLFCFQVCWNTDQTSWAEMVKVLLVNFCVVSKRANRELHFTNQPFYIWLETLETHNCIYFNIPTTCTHPQVIHQQPSASPTWARQLSSYPVSPTGGHPSPSPTNNCTPPSCCPFFATQSSKFFLFSLASL